MKSGEEGRGRDMRGRVNEGKEKRDNVEIGIFRGCVILKKKISLKVKGKWI